MADSVKLHIPDQVAGYKKIGAEPLGVGGMGVVWLFKEVGLPGREVAIKFINAAKMQLNKANLMREIQVLSALPPHQNVISMHAVIEDPLAIVMEYVPGNASLRSIIKRNPEGLPIGQAVQILKGILEGVAHAHEHRVFHRDIKPENVLIRLAERQQQITSRCIKIVDFGISKVYMEGGLAGAPSEIRADGGKPLLTLMGAYTEAYAAPEQINGEATGAYTDIYQIGTILYEMLSGSKPFTGKTSDVIAGHCYSKLPAIERDDVPGPLRALLATATCKNPKERFQDAEEMLRALNDLGDLGEYGEMPGAFDDGASYTEESVTIRAGIKKRHSLSKDGPTTMHQQTSQRGPAPERPIRPGRDGKAKGAGRGAKRPAKKYALLAVAAIALLAVALPLSGQLGKKSKKAKPRTPAASQGGLSGGPLSASSGAPLGVQSGSYPSSYQGLGETSPARSSYTSAQAPPSGQSQQSAAAPAPPRALAAPSPAAAPAQPQADRSAAAPKTSGIGEALGGLAGAAVHEVAQAKERQDLGSIVDKGLGFVSAFSGQDQITYRPPAPPWPPDAPYGPRQVVRVQLDVGPDGQPGSPKVLGSPPPAFHAPAIDYAMRHKFRPRADSKAFRPIISAQFEPPAG